MILTSDSELAKFHNNAANADTRSFATYLVSGELLPTRRIKPRASTQTEDGMDVDSEAAVVDVDSDSDEEDVPVTTMTLVGENELERTSSFRIATPTIINYVILSCRYQVKVRADILHSRILSKPLPSDRACHFLSSMVKQGTHKGRAGRRPHMRSFKYCV